MWLSLYWLAMYGYVGLIRLASLWNPEAREWTEGRKSWRDRLRSLPAAKSPRIWFHVASLGEFEQARPVIEGLKALQPEVDIVLTFFSPSGYRQRKDYALASVFYLPADLPGHARYWLDAVRPDLAVFVKYDLWPGFVRAAIRQDIPTILVSAHWDPGSRYTSWSNPLVKPWLHRFRKIFLQRDTGLEALQAAGFDNLVVAGDTRIDRALELPAETPARLAAGLQEAGPFEIVAGSTWPPDEAILFEATRDRPGPFLIAPHDVSEENILRLVAAAPGACQRWSRFDPVKPFRYLVVDGIGMLAYLYNLGSIAYVGGGFGSGIHNTLEPMAHGRPVLFGPNFRRFPEAVEAVEEGAAFPVADSNSLAARLALLSDAQVRARAGDKAFRLLEKNQGATKAILAYIRESLPFAAS